MAPSRQASAGKAEKRQVEDYDILPYTSVVGQTVLKEALELAYIAQGIGGVLLSGDRGTAKSTAVRAFARMMYGSLPVTLPINATEDRVVGGWQLESLLEGKHKEQPGLLEEADGRLLYVDEVNLLDDHIVNIILDVASTGVLDVQRESFKRRRKVRFTLVGTMNPEEGGLRPQLLDRFGLMVGVEAETNSELRSQILRTVLDFDRARQLAPDERKKQLVKATRKDEERKSVLVSARTTLASVRIDDRALNHCIHVAKTFEAQGHRGEQSMALAAKAYVSLGLAAGEKRKAEVSVADINHVAPLAIRHRRPKGLKSDALYWTKEDTDKLSPSPSPNSLVS